MEDKNLICDKLVEVLQLTRGGQDVKAIEYLTLPDDNEIAAILFENGHIKRVNVSADSGLAMIRDITRAL